MIPSASGLTRAFKCKASMLLPQVRRESGKAAHKGSAVHAFLENAPKLGRDAALMLIEDESARLLCEALDLDGLPLGDGVSWAAEVAFSMDLSTMNAREVGRGIGRAYPDDGGLHGTADLVALSPDKETVFVLDAKTGHGWIPPASESAQLKALALMAMQTYGASRAKVGHLHLRDDGSAFLDWAELDSLDLLAFAAEVWNLTTATKADPVEGPWCRYCPALPHCPAKAKLAVALGAGMPVADVSVALTTETAAKAWERIKAAKLVLGEVEAAVRSFALDNPVTLSDGSILGPVETESRELDGPKTFATLAKAYGPEVAEAACGREATFKSIDAAMRQVKKNLEAKGEKATLKALKESAEEVLKKNGALSVTRSVAVKERAAK